MPLATRLGWRSLASSLYARMALILLAGLLVAQGVSMWLQWGERAAVVTQARGLHMMDRIAESVRLLEASAPTQRPSALAALQHDGLRVALITEQQAQAGTLRETLQETLSERLGSPRQIRVLGGAGLGMGMGMGPGMGAGQQRGNLRRNVDVRLADGQWIRITTALESDAAAPALSNTLIIQLLVSLALVAAVVIFAVRQATLPLQQLAQAANALGLDLDAQPLPERGSTETRHAAQAFNRMQTRIQRLVRERARALAAVSHDLRTPLTRLRLRAELIEDEPLRDQMATDLEAMAAMIDTTLEYMRGLQSRETVRAIDINALLESMADDALVLGRCIQIEGRTLQPFHARLTGLRRALQNLIDNAFKYAHGVRILVQDSTVSLRISVEDDGPGIAPADLPKVTEPYYRTDCARSQPGDGIGLGLSIVRDIALMHDGELILTNRAQGGLAATLCLPRKSSPLTKKFV
ncbi:MAG: ATP-binding protein [Rhodoferax sp.]